MSTSPPPTPPSRAPTSRDEIRFKSIDLPSEWVENYHPDGYHPVVLGDVFNDGQYKVVRKLGHGSYSTVWLARDLRSVHLLHRLSMTLWIMAAHFLEGTVDMSP